MAKSKSKKPEVQALIPQGANRPSEIQIRDPITGGTKAVRPEDVLPRNEVQSLVTPQLLQNSNEFNKAASVQQAPQVPQPTPEQLASSGIIPQGQVQNGAQLPPLASNQNSSVVSPATNPQVPMEDANILQAPTLPGLNLLARTPEEAQQRNEIRAQTAQMAAGLVGAGLLQSATKTIGAKAALNTAPEAAHFTGKFAQISKSILRGSAPEVGKAALNTKAAALRIGAAKGVWVTLGKTVTGLALLSSILDEGWKSTKYVNMIGDIKKEIAENNKIIANEQIEEIREAYIQENALLVNLLDEVTDPQGWEGFIKSNAIPIVDAAAARSVVGKARLEFDESKEVRQANIELRKSNLIRQYPPAIRAYLLKTAKENKELEVI